MRAHQQVTFEASPIARIIRRDWNFVSIKLYIHAFDPEYSKIINDDIIDFAWQVDDAYDDISRMPFQKVDATWMRPRSMSLEIVHPITARWFKTMIKLDKIYSALVSAEKAGLISKRKRHAFILPSLIAYTNFKSTATKIKFYKDDEEDLIG